MPIYEYKCKKCGCEFEVFHKMSDAEVKNCKFCHGPVSKLISLSSFQLQGSGWYVTDYGGKKPKKTESKREEGTTESKKESTDTASSTSDKK